MAKCLLFLHKFSDWRHSPPKDPCRHTRTCQRCGIKQVREFAKEHQWQDIKISDPCAKRSECKNCGCVRIDYLAHDLGPWTYERPGSCWASQFCRRCGKEQMGKQLRHDPDPGGFMAINPCTTAATCRRCGNKVVGKTKHQGEWRYAGYTWKWNSLVDSEERVSVYRCTVCGGTKEEY